MATEKKPEQEIVKVNHRVNFNINGRLKKIFLEDCIDREEKPTVVARDIFRAYYKSKGKL